MRLESLRAVSARREVDIPISEPSLQQPMTVRSSGFSERKFHRGLFAVQACVAFLCAWACNQLMGLKNRLGLPDWMSVARFVFLDERRYVFWGLFSVSSLCFLLWLLAYWPGAMTGDSWAVLDEVQTLVWSDWHPYVYKLYLLGLFQLFNSVAAVGIFQLLLTAALGAYVFYEAWRAGVRPLFLAPFFALFCLSIPIGLYNITLWKDVPFSLCVTAFSLMLYKTQIIREKSGSLVQIPSACYLPIGILLIGLCHFRQNGLMFYALAPLLLWSRIRKTDFFALCVFLTASFFAITVVIPRVCRIAKTNGAPIFQLRAALALTTHYNFYSRDRQEDFHAIEAATGLGWDKIMSLYPRHWFPLWDSTRMVKEGLQFAPSGGETEDYNKRFLLRLINGNLPIFMASRTYEFFHAIGVDQSVSDFTTDYYENPLQLHGNNLHPPGKFMYGVAVPSRSRCLWLTKMLDCCDGWSRRFDGLLSPQVLTWNLLVFLSVFIAILFYESGRSAIGLFILPNLAAAGGVFVVGAGESWRYFYYLYLSGIFVIPLYLAYRKESPRIGVSSHGQR